jgi:hypothetical protein
LGGRALPHPLFLFCACQGDDEDDEQEVFKRRLSAMSPKARKNYALGLMAALRGDRDRRTEKRGGQQRVGHHSWELADRRLLEWCLACRLTVLFFFCWQDFFQQEECKTVGSITFGGDTEDSSPRETSCFIPLLRTSLTHPCFIPLYPCC